MPDTRPLTHSQRCRLCRDLGAYADTGLCTDCDAFVTLVVTRAVEEERAACQNAMCGRCARGERVIEGDGAWWHLEDGDHHGIDRAFCHAGRIRERGKG